VRLTTQVLEPVVPTLSDAEVEMVKRKPEKDEINLIITNPLHWKLNATANRNWVYLIWEGDKIPKSFIAECKNPDIEYILVPSYHTKKAIVKSINRKVEDLGLGKLFYKPQDIIDKIKVIPHGVNLDNLDIFHSQVSSAGNTGQGYKFAHLTPGKTVFIANKGFRNLEDRGGIQYLLKAYIEEFADEDDVELLIKLNPAYPPMDIQEAIDKLTDKKENLPKLTVTLDNLKYEEMNQLYYRGNVFVSPTRAEAFNLPCLEAMACGLPVITTNFGGQTDYVNNENGWIVGGELTEVKHELLYEGVKWLTPSIDELKKVMREVHNGKTRREEKAKKAQEVAKQMSWDVTASKIVDLV